MELAVCKTSCFGIAIFPTVDGEHIVDTCGYMNTLNTPFAGELTWQCVAKCDVVQTNETTVVNLLDTCYTGRTDGIQTSIVIGRILGCPIFLLVGITGLSKH